jgi:Fe-S cluster assembly protein SufD
MVNESGERMNVISFVFIDGEFNEDLSDISLLPSAISFKSEKNKIQLHIPQKQISPLPIHFKYLNGCKDLQHKIIMEEQSSMVFIEEYASNHEDAYLTNAMLEVQLNKHANMHYYKIQNENQQASHQGCIQVEQKESSDIKMFFADCGSNKSRSDVKIKLQERYASCCMNGLYFLNHDDQQIDNAIHVEHMAELGTSSMVFKGVLDKKSKAQFLGKVHVYENAKRTNAHQENHNLLLSSTADVTSQPKLEIYADDIKCTHGATVGQLDQDSLFYLRSRGIDKNTALKMLTDAFVAEIVEKIEDLSIRNYIQQRISQHEAF